jgi:hypothetical protein
MSLIGAGIGGAIGALYSGVSEDTGLGTGVLIGAAFGALAGQSARFIRSSKGSAFVGAIRNDIRGLMGSSVGKTVESAPASSLDDTLKDFFKRGNFKKGNRSEWDNGGQYGFQRENNPYKSRIIKSETPQQMRRHFNNPPSIRQRTDWPTRRYQIGREEGLMKNRAQINSGLSALGMNMDNTAPFDASDIWEKFNAPHIRKI